MTQTIRDQDIQALRSTVNITDFISRHQTLSKRDDGMWEGPCPFHPDPETALQVNAAQGFFHCRVCAAGGDVIAYLMRREPLTFAEAYTKLRRLYP